jgi:hypothetical protein
MKENHWFLLMNSLSLTKFASRQAKPAFGGFVFYMPKNCTRTFIASHAEAK